MITTSSPKVIFRHWIFAMMLFCPVLAFPQAQELTGDTLSQIQFIQGCASYRQSIIHDIESALSDFTILADGLASTSSNPEVHIALRDGIIQATLKEEQEVSKSSIYNAIHKLAQKDSMALRLYESWLKENSLALTELQFLVAYGILDAKSPFKLGSLKEIWREFSFYGLKANMTIADIGAGNGVISFILLESGLPLKLIMTEIDEDFLQLLEHKIDQYKVRTTGDSILLRNGGERTLGLQDLKVDLMIFREVFHHLKYPMPILEEISNHLKENGYVVLKEGTRDFPDKDQKPCSKATTHRQIIKEWTAAGFVLVAEEIIDGSYLMKFKPSI